MAHNVYISAAEARSGKSFIVLGVMRSLLQQVQRVAIFRPIINTAPEYGEDSDITLMCKHFALDVAYEDTYALTLDQAREFISNGQYSLLIEAVLHKYKKLEANYDFVVCEGTDYMGKDVALEFDLNADLAANLGAPFLLVVNGFGKSKEELQASVQITMNVLADKGIDVAGCMVNRAGVTAAEASSLGAALQASALPVYLFPEKPTLAAPKVGNMAEWLGATVLQGHESLNNAVHDTFIAGMLVEPFLEQLLPHNLVILPYDRSDLILATLATRFSKSCPEVAGILLAGQPSNVATLAPVLQTFIKGCSGKALPILAVPHGTQQVLQRISSRHGKIEPHDTSKIDMALAHFEKHANVEELATSLAGAQSLKITPKMFEFKLMEQAKRQKMRIVLPEGQDERILQAAENLHRREVAEIVLLGNKKHVQDKIRELGLQLDGVELLQPELTPQFEAYTHAYYEARKHRGVTEDQARELMRDVAYFGTMMVEKGDANGMVSGAVNTTAHTIRPALEFVKTKSGFSIVSSVFLMCLRDRVLVFGDCAVNPNPTAQQLAEIAVASVHTAKIFGVEPKVAMLSYSTGGSGKGADVDIVIEATQLAQKMAPDLLLEGPLQYDAAIDMSVAQKKLPGSKVAGQATVFIFPDLNTGNNTYKAVQRAAGAVAIGPVLQGLRKPVNDLSRGCTVADIINTVAITAIQAQAEITTVP